MAKKNLIISAFTGYNFEHLKPYVRSIDKYAPDADKVMVIGHTELATRVHLMNMGWRLEELPNFAQIPIHVLRFLPMYAFLQEHPNEYDLVISTDVKDVVFQRDPFQWLENNLGDKKLVAGSEALKYCDEPWGNENLHDTYGNYVHEIMKDCTIYNVGTLGGRAEYMRDLFLNLFYNSISRPIPIVDQAVFNFMIQTYPVRDSVMFAEQRHAWACQAGTVADPKKMPQFRPNLLEPEPIWRDGKVYTSEQQEFVIVHQYDRVPEWRQSITEQYKSRSSIDFEKEFNIACGRDTDINEHLPILSLLAEECQHVTELGVGWAQSTRAFLRHDIELHSYEITPAPWIEEYFQDAKRAGRRVTLHVADTRQVEIAPTDLLFIDSLHVYEQVKEELRLHAAQAKKYIVFHDTTLYADRGEFNGRGIWPAIQEFMDSHPEWQLVKRLTNNNGLTILHRIENE